VQGRLFNEPPAVRLQQGSTPGMLALSTTVPPPTCLRAKSSVASRGYNKAIEINTRHAKAYFNRGRASEAEGDPNAQSQIYQSNQDHPAGRRRLLQSGGLPTAPRGEFGYAIADYTKAIEINPQHAAAYNSRSAAFEATGDLDHAIEDHRRAIEISPQQPEPI
jgi:Flp pilus assembly protein TadD